MPDCCVQVLTQQLWPILGIPPTVHTSLQAWILFRQYAACADPALLEGAKELLATALASHQGHHPDNAMEDQGQLITGREFAEDIGEAIADWV